MAEISAKLFRLSISLVLLGLLYEIAIIYTLLLRALVSAADTGTGINPQGTNGMDGLIDLPIDHRGPTMGNSGLNRTRLTVRHFNLSCLQKFRRPLPLQHKMKTITSLASLMGAIRTSWR